MEFINWLSLALIPFIIATILLYGTFKKFRLMKRLLRGEGRNPNCIFHYPLFSRYACSDHGFPGFRGARFFMNLLKPVFSAVGIPTEVVPLALIRPISGTAALGMTTDLIAVYGPDSFIGRLASVMQGSTDTTLYVLTVYFGAVGIKKMGDALKVGLLADLAGVIASVIIVTLLFGSA